MFGHTATDVVQFQFLLSQYGIGIDVSNRLALFEAEIYVSFAQKAEQEKYEMLSGENHT